MAKLTATAAQTVGPFFAYGLIRDDDARIAGDAAKGERIALTGGLYDHNGAPVRDALIEVWQADAAGRYPGRDADADPSVRGFGRTLTDAEGRFRFDTVLPGPSAGPGNAPQAPHFAIGVFAAGLNRRVATRIYVPDAAELDADAVRACLPEGARRGLTAGWIDAKDGARRLGFDIRLGGPEATPVLTD